jgi:carboxymethylenebutenolidase
MGSETIEIGTADGVADAYLSKPDREGRHPGVILLMDAFGLRPQIEQMADRIASRGYVVLAPNLFYRAGKDAVGEMPDMSQEGSRTEFFQKLRSLMDELTPNRIASDADAYLSRLESESDGPIAISGYCMGARVGLRIAEAHPDRLVALGGFHAGGLVTDAPDSPHRSVANIRAELYFGFAENDPSMTEENIAEFRRALDEAGVGYRAEVYEGAGHGYTMADMPVYDEAAAERHYDELFALLERTTRESTRAR